MVRGATGADGRLIGLDGTELLFVSASDTIVSGPVTAGPTFSWGAPRELFALDERSSWTGETAADGQEFILRRSVREAPGQVILVRNFDRLLREKLGG